MKGQVTPWDGSMPGRNGGALLNVTGGWGAVDPAGPTSGSPFTVPVDGTLFGQVNISGYATAQGLRSFDIFIDGALACECRHFFNVTNTHLMMSPGLFFRQVAAGTHYIFVKRATANLASDSGDRLTLFGIVV